LNLLPTDFSDDLVLLTFWREGTKFRDVRVRDFAPDHRILERMVSHYHWGTVHGIDAKGQLKVERADGKIFFSMSAQEKRYRPNKSPACSRQPHQKSPHESKIRQCV